MNDCVVSSHWEHHLKTMTGFGTLRNDTMQNNIKYAIEILLAKSLFRKYDCDPYLVHQGKMIAARTNRLFDFDCVKQILSLNLINTVMNGKVLSVCVIGDGYGYFTSLIRAVFPDVFIVCINLEQILEIDYQYYRKIYPEDSKIVFINAENYNRIKDYHINLFINIVGFQEMNPPVIAKYFEYMRASKAKDKYFYCCSRREKILPDGTTTIFTDYPWIPCVTLFDQICPWYKEYPQSYPPFWKPFDGVVQHRLVKL